VLTSSYPKRTANTGASRSAERVDGCEGRAVRELESLWILVQESPDQVCLLVVLYRLRFSCLFLDKPAKAEARGAYRKDRPKADKRPSRL